MIQYHDYLTEEIENATKRALGEDAHDRTRGFCFLMGLRQGAYHLVGMESELYRKIDARIDFISEQRQKQMENTDLNA